MNGLQVSEALEMVRRWIAESHRGSEIEEVPPDFATDLPEVQVLPAPEGGCA